MCKIVGRVVNCHSEGVKWLKNPGEKAKYTVDSSLCSEWR